MMAQGGELEIFVSPDNAGDHHVYAVGDDDRPVYAIEGVSLDEYFADRPDRTVNVVKIDMQGARPRRCTDAQRPRRRRACSSSPARPAVAARRRLVGARVRRGARGRRFELHVIDEDAGTVTLTSAERLAASGTSAVRTS